MTRFVGKAVVGGLAAALVLALIAAVWIFSADPPAFPDTPLPAIAASTDADVIARGEYLVQAVAHCGACHETKAAVETHAFSFDGGALVGGAELPGGPLGVFRPTNLTPDTATGIGSSSDGQLARALRFGVDRTGHYAPLMAQSVGAMADEDLIAVVSYLRTLPASSSATKPDSWGLVERLLSRGMKPRALEALTWVAPGGVSLERGKYLANGPAACAQCHSPRNPLASYAETGPRFSGEAAPKVDPTDEAMELVAPNLTPHAETGALAALDEEKFVARFKQGRTFAGSPMPWEHYQRLTEDDVRSLYRYLTSLTPVHHYVGPSRREQGWSSGYYKPPSEQAKDAGQ